MQRRLTEVVKEVAMKEAKRSVGKSWYMGAYEIKVPKELKDMIREKEE